MRRFLTIFFISFALIVFFVSTDLTQTFDRWSFNDALFVRSVAETMFIVGLIMFFIGIVMVTGASEIFIAIGFTFKNIFKRHRVKYESYYQYMKEQKDEEGSKMTGVAPLIISIIYLSITLYLSYFII